MKLVKRPLPPEDKPGVDRRTFIKRSAVATGGSLLAGSLSFKMMRRVEAHEGHRHDDELHQIKTVCTHCSVGCGVIAEVRNGVWIGQEPAFDHPFNLGAHCAKGASVREHGHGEKRLKYPLKMENGQWRRITWEQAIDEIGARLLAIRERSGPDAVYWLGSSKHNNEQAYLLRKFVALWGTNNVDHQARICHSTTVAGVANTWGYGAMTNSYNDIHHSQSILIIGGNPAEAHPVSMQHIFRAKERGARLIVVDPRFTRTAAHADQYVRIRSGGDIAFVYGLLWHIFKNGWEDKDFIEHRVYGMESIREEATKWPPDEVERVTGIPEEEVFQVAKTLADHRPGTVVWCMGITQHHHGNNQTRLLCILQLALGNMGVAGGGTNIFRGHDNVQGATDVGPNAHTLPGYYGLNEGAWRHWAKVWDLDFQWLSGRFDPQEYNDGKGGKSRTMFQSGIPVSRWIDGVLEDRNNLSQRDNLRAMVFWGHAPNSQTRGPEMKRAFEKLELLVVIDPYPSVSAVMHERQNDTYLLPACTQFETRGSVTASNRSVQWRNQVIEPLFESKPDHVIMYLLAKRLGFAGPLTKHIEVKEDEPVIEDILGEINRGTWTIGYTGHSPERLKLQQQNWHTFDTTTLRAEGGPCDGEYYGLPWPCWGTPRLKHPGTPILYDLSKSVAEGGLPFRARFGVERDGVSLLAHESYTRGSEIKDGYPEFSAEMLKQLGWWQELTPEEQQAAEGKNWKTDLSGGIQRVAIAHGCAPFGNAKARCIVWTFPDPIPIHREPIYSNRRDLVVQSPTYADRKRFYRLPTRYASLQQIDFSHEFPLVMTSGRLVEYEGGGDETRSNPWLAELQQDMFIEIHPADANDADVRHRQMVWVEGPEGGRIRVMAFVTERVPRGTVFMPFHFGGWWEGKDLKDRYPEGTAPFVRGESCNVVFTYGYDSVTMMQETKVSLCRVKGES